GIYESNEPYPSNWFTYNIGAGIQNGEHAIFLSIHAFPARYIPLTNELEYVNEMNIEINYIPPEKPMLDNDVYDLLIVTPAEFSDALQPLVEHKESYGVKTMLVSLDEIYNGNYFTVQGRDDAEKIKYFIKGSIEQWGINYVMLVGGYKHLPVRYAYLNDRSSSWEYERKFISDLYYADIYDSDGHFSSWDTNGNGYYGEYDHETSEGKKTDSLDLYPDVYIGRLACRNKIEVKTVVEKIIQYESDESKNEWFKNMVLCGGDLYPNDPCGDVAEGIYLEEEIAKQMADFNIIREYPSNGMNMFTISKSINQGAGFVVFAGAGAQHLWATHPYDEEKWIYYYNANIRSLKNRQMVPIVLTSGAHLSQFNNSQECFNWVFVSKKKGGAVASIGSTGLCWIAHGENVASFYLGNLHLRLFQEYHNTNILGMMVSNAITSYLNSFDPGHHGISESFHMKAAEELELFGDPTLKVGQSGNDGSTAKTYGKTLYVGGSGPNNYTSIQDAIDDAGNGDKVFVYNGTYHEDIKINKSISLVGQSEKGVILESNGTTLIADAIDIKEFTIKSNGNGKNEAGIHCYGKENIIENATISGYDWGVYLENAQGNVIENNHIMLNNEYAVYMNNSSNVLIQNNTIEKNWYGLWSEYSPALTIRKNNFSSNRWYALWLDGSGKSDIAGNTFIKNWYSIYLYDSSNSNISENKIVKNEHGPQFVNSNSNSFNKNNVEKNEHYGIFVGWRSAGNTFTDNNFIENAQNARDDHGSTWDGNYWSDYIGIKIKILGLIRLPYHIPGRINQWDWHPRMAAYG
ncbi:MAG: C25 family cysteine peptidase, partial [Candidatus Thermoplasmatota archaeon]|nr:C25 family cysteine peptidase [Candidatus Thermoplasmatota archaeon]